MTGKCIRVGGTVTVKRKGTFVSEEYTPGGFRSTETKARNKAKKKRK